MTSSTKHFLTSLRDVIVIVGTLLLYIYVEHMCPLLSSETSRLSWQRFKSYWGPNFSKKKIEPGYRSLYGLNLSITLSLCSSGIGLAIATKKRKIDFGKTKILTKKCNHVFWTCTIFEYVKRFNMVTFPRSYSENVVYVQQTADLTVNQWRRVRKTGNE